MPRKILFKVVPLFKIRSTYLVLHYRNRKQRCYICKQYFFKNETFFIKSIQITSKKDKKYYEQKKLCWSCITHFHDHARQAAIKDNRIFKTLYYGYNIDFEFTLKSIIKQNYLSNLLRALSSMANQEINNKRIPKFIYHKVTYLLEEQTLIQFLKDIYRPLNPQYSPKSFEIINPYEITLPKSIIRPAKHTFKIKLKGRDYIEVTVIYYYDNDTKSFIIYVISHIVFLSQGTEYRIGAKITI